MWRESKFKVQSLAAVLVALSLFGFTVQKISPKLQEKIDNAVETTFEVEGFSLEPLVVDADLNEKTPVELRGENLFSIRKEGKSIGYVYLGEAPSMKKVFDYVVLFNSDMSIKKSKILIYREDYGRQVGSQRWLKQFIGKKSGESLIYGEDIDAISGATISAKSMTLAVNNVLLSMKVLQEHNFFE